MNLSKGDVCGLSSDLVDQLILIRQHLHQYPELSFQEKNTCEYIISCLKNWGIPYQKKGETGIVVDIIGEKGEGQHIGLRADIDALPILEQTGLAYSSKNPGVMHACGHDGHTTILLGVVHQLFNLKGKISGRVRCIFQPGEEADGAARQMIEQGVLENPAVDCMVALHLWPQLPLGSVGVKYGPVTAACEEFVIVIKGKAGHSARPHQAIDAISISAQILHALSFLVTKGSNPVEPIVIHVGKIQGGTASNIVADRVVLEGTMRTVTQEARIKLKRQVSQLVERIVDVHDARAIITYTDGTPPVINDDRLTKCLEESTRDLLGSSNLFVLKEPSMGADDFGNFAEKVPSTYFRLGIRKEDQEIFDLHHPQFQFDDQVIPIGVKVLVSFVSRLLQKGE